MNEQVNIFNMVATVQLLIGSFVSLTTIIIYILLITIYIFVHTCSNRSTWKGLYWHDHEEDEDHLLQIGTCTLIELEGSFQGFFLKYSLLVVCQGHLTSRNVTGLPGQALYVRLFTVHLSCFKYIKACMPRHAQACQGVAVAVDLRIYTRLRASPHAQSVIQVDSLMVALTYLPGHACSSII